jgi:hypothetical protein
MTTNGASGGVIVGHGPKFRRVKVPNGKGGFDELPEFGRHLFEIDCSADRVTDDTSFHYVAVVGHENAGRYEKLVRDVMTSALLRLAPPDPLEEILIWKCEGHVIHPGGEHTYSFVRYRAKRGSGLVAADGQSPLAGGGSIQ